MFDYNFDHAGVIAALGIEDSDADFQGHVLKRIDTLLSARVGGIIQSQLSDEDALELQKIGENREAASAYLMQRFPNWKDIHDQQLQFIVGELKAAMPKA